MNAVNLLSKDHRTVEKLFADFGSKKAGRATAGIVRKIVQELTIHAEVEERFLYPEAKRRKSTASLVKEAVAEHAKVKKILAAIVRAGADRESVASKVAELEQNVSHHVEEEESELFPKLETELGEARLAEIGAEIRRAKVGRGGPRKPSRLSGKGTGRGPRRSTKKRRKPTTRRRRAQKRSTRKASGKGRRVAR
jgi:hemerythrin superfamily protein